MLDNANSPTDWCLRKERWKEKEDYTEEKEATGGNEYSYHSWLWWQFHRYIHMFKITKLYILHINSLCQFFLNKIV